MDVGLCQWLLVAVVAAMVEELLLLLEEFNILF